MGSSNLDDSMAAAKHLRGMAVHEAGHAVAAWSFNLVVGNIFIREIGAGNGGAQIGCADHLPLIDQLAVLVAGKVAERMFKSPLPDYAGNSDSLMAINLILKYHTGASSDEIERHLTSGHVRARALLAEHRDSVIRLADRLSEIQRVDAVEFLRLACA